MKPSSDADCKQNQDQLSDQPWVAIVVPLHNRLEYTQKLIESFKTVTYRNYSFVFVDDGSTDGTGDWLRTHCPQATILQGDGNLFWTAAINMGVKDALQSKPQYIMTLNNDVEVTSTFLTQLVDVALSAPKSLVAPIIFYKEDPNILFSAGGKLVWGRGDYFDMTVCGDHDVGQYPKLAEQDALAGNCVLIDVCCFDHIGLYDQQTFPHYHADLDFAIRARKAGFTLLCTTEAIVFNSGSSTGMLGRYARCTYQKLLPILWSKKSPANVFSTCRLHFRHCPVYKIPYSLFMFYAGIYGRYVYWGVRRIMAMVAGALGLRSSSESR